MRDRPLSVPSYGKGTMHDGLQTRLYEMQSNSSAVRLRFIITIVT